MRPRKELLIRGFFNKGKMVLDFLTVALGGAIGTMARYGLTVCINHFLHPSVLETKNIFLVLPWATLGANIIGSFLVGLISSWVGLIFPTSLRLFLIIGFCGGFTTFSAFMFEVYAFLQARHFFIAGIYFCCAILLPFLALYFGITLVKSFITKE